MFNRRVLIAAFAGLALSLCGSAGTALARGHERPTEPLQITTGAGKVVRLKVEVVDTDASRERGLMFRMSLRHDHGMLFDFKQPQEQVSFWMKNTFIPLDIIFISPDGEIVNIAKRATPFDETPLPSAGPVLGVLEINGGESDELGLGPGDKVRQRMFERPLGARR